MAGGHVLIVDDDPRITRLVRRVAEKVGFSVTEFNDSVEFENSYSSLSASLIILDLNMPGKDGIELLEFLADKRCASQVMFISGVDRRVLGTTEQLAISRGLNIAGMLPKPVDVTELRRVLSDHARDHGVPTVDDLDDVLDAGNISVVYQAKIDLGSGNVVGAEALARWQHPELGSVSPELFVEMAETTGRIDKLTELVFGQAIRAAKDWTEIAPNLTVAVNISPQLLTDFSLPDRLDSVMKAMDFQPENLKLEITERGVMQDVNRSMSILSRIRLKGIGLSIDDFGTGSSSLVQLYRMPFGEIKIDRSFVADMLKNREAEVIVNSIIQLGKSMELSVVAEGVEDAAVMDALRDLGCDQAQGYFIHRPLPEPEFSKWLSERGVPSQNARFTT